MAARLVGNDHDSPSAKQLQAFCDGRLIAAQADPMLVDLRQSIGALLALPGSNEFILDTCLQVTCNALGFSSNPLFGCCQHLESWTGDYTTPNIQSIANAYRDLLKRLLGHFDDELHVHFCPSVTEAVEISLGLCFANRANRHAHRVLAFERSSHGRTMVALAASGNSSQRATFAGPECHAEFAPYPECKSGDVVSPPFGSQWLRHWSQRTPSCESVHELESELEGAADEQAIVLLRSEIASLQAVREKLAGGEIFAILAEPMQRDGGRYASSRFHHGLVALGRAYGVPVVYDETQTGFHLGSRFFWHSQFELRDVDQQPTGPDVIAGGQPGQVGVVISRFPITYHESFCPASLIRGYVTASILEQFAARIDSIAAQVRQWLAKAVREYQPVIGYPRSQGTAFAFEFQQTEPLSRFLKSGAEAGMLFCHEEDRAVQFRLNLSSSESDIAHLCERLDRCLGDAVAGPVTAVDTGQSEEPVASNDSGFDFHHELTNAKLARVAGSRVEKHDVVDYFDAQLRSLQGTERMEMILLNAANYPRYRDSILQMQREVYEPVRQSPPEAFDLLFDNDHSVESPALLLVIDQRIAAMAFCGPLSCFLQERGVADDPFLADEKTFYMLDLTVAPGFRGRGLGRIMKNAITLLAINRGVNAIHGRNRDRLARAMWAINLSLGSYEQQHLFDDYPDAKPFRDCLYYRCPLQWQTDNGTSDLAFPQLDVSRLSSEYLQRNMPALVNRICRSGVFTESYLDDLSVVSQNFPAELRHLYSTNSLSEAVDTVARAIWLKRPTATGLLTIRGHDFGAGTFLARTLSGVEEPFFAVARLEPERVVDELQRHLETGDWLALFVQTNPMRGREDLLRQCLAICREWGLPIVFNETDPQFGTSAQLSRQPELVPDAGVVWLGGQLALAYVRDCFFDDDPLSLINIWEGDPYALARFAETMRQQND